MKILENKTYKDFVLMHILRPYQNMIGIEKRIEKFNSYTYERLPKLCKKNPEWENCVFNRISRIYSHIEESIFPSDETGIYIKNKLQEYGIKIKESRD
jgi:hypothetical protein